MVLTEGVATVDAEISAWARAGGTHASVVTMRLGLGSVDDHIEYMASVGKTLNPS